MTAVTQQEDAEPMPERRQHIVLC